MGNIYLSPHSDDICFSLGDFVSENRGGTLLTLFSRSARTLGDAHPDPEREATEAEVSAADRVSRLRQAEDLAFAQRVGMKAVFAGLDDAPLRDRDSLAVEKSLEDAATFEDAILAAIGSAATDMRNSRPQLFCPLGIGDHVDHLAVLHVVARNFEELRTRYDICFYEDLPYAAKAEYWRSGIIRAKEILKGADLHRQMHLIRDSSRKIELLRLYESQFDRPPDEIMRFVPAAGVFQRPHEGLWRIA